ncbi:hypothetical protein B0H66DRAFT_557089 [Apodospora peruviana]|uniref:Zn(2)-C6 fungal-type domain-containing protein n=1 Tax=Apodospora peruviana TaxID=516989 RepID=A0AAE0M4G4_9PEZI|nr:hypothetical protein B0H66DRAFT_557089 [Apodospora peruviana]
MPLSSAKEQQPGNGVEFVPQPSGPESASAAAPVSTSSSVPPPPPPVSDAGADAGSEPPVNPRKRKKASRACDFCHVNHQPCDNGKPKCSVCQKHNKPCLYLRPTKRRGPQKGYRTALNTYKESAAAWGAVLAAIPGLDALIEGHLRGGAGKSIVASIKDSNQQEALITSWQDSSVFKAFFGHNGPAPLGAASSIQGDGILQGSQDVDDDDFSGDERSSARPVPGPPSSSKSALLLQSEGGGAPTETSQCAVPQGGPPKTPPSIAAAHRRRKGSVSLSDIVAKDAAQGSSRASQTLASLGFAPDETIADFYSMGSNPEPIAHHNGNDHQGFDPALGSESEQRAYYELLMGRSFPG